MKVSIITVCYNAENSIEETILSVINQTYKNIEYIVIDGASTDRTVDIIEKYRNKIAYFVSERDTGIYNAMNKAIGASQGDFIYFLNAGDTIYSTETVEKVTKYLKTGHEHIFYGNIMFYDKKLDAKWLVPSGDIIDRAFFVKDDLAHQAIFYKRQVFDIAGLYDESYKVLADCNLNVKSVIRHGLKARKMSLTIAVFELGGPSTSQRNNLENCNEKERVLNNYYSPLEIKLYTIIFILSSRIKYLPLRKIIRSTLQSIIGLIRP